MSQIEEQPVEEQIGKSPSDATESAKALQTLSHVDITNNLEDPVNVLHEELQKCPCDHSNRPTIVNKLANALVVRFKERNNVSDLESAIELLREGVQLRPPGHEDRAISLINLGNAIATRFEKKGNTADLDEVIELYREVLKLLPVAHPNHPNLLDKVGNALSFRFHQKGNIMDLEDAIKVYNQALLLWPAGNPSRPSTLNNLANAVTARFYQQGKTADMETAIQLHREALELVPPTHPDHCAHLDNLAMALSTRFEQQGNFADLEDAIKYHREAMKSRPAQDPHRASALNGLANAVSTRFEQRGDIADLEEAIVLYNEALQYIPLGHPARSGFIGNLANSIFNRFQQQGNTRDLEESITLHRKALELRPEGHPHRSTSLGDLGPVLSARFDQYGKIADLEDAIRYHREALALRPLGHPDRAASLSNLANAIGTRFKQQDNVADLEELITLSRESLRLVPLEHPNHSIALNNLANALMTHFKQRKDMAYLEESIQLHRSALQFRAPGHPDRNTSLNNLAIAISLRYEEQHNIADLDDSVQLHHEALKYRPPGHPSRPATFNCLAVAANRRFQAQGDIANLDEAIKLHRESLAGLPDHHPLRSNFASDCADSYMDRYNATHDKADMEEAIRLFADATNSRTTSPLERFRVSLHWIAAAQRGSHPSRVLAYSTSLTLLQLSVLGTTSIKVQHDALARAPKSLASDAAACAIAEGQPELALQLLEQGRAIVWSRMSGYRLPLDALREANEPLADEFDSISHQLEAAAVTAGIESDAQKHRLLSEKWDDVVDRIRQIAGFVDFLRAEPFSRLRLAAAEGPVVVVNVSRYRSDALIVQGGTEPLLPVPLPDATPDAVQDIAVELEDTVSSGIDDNHRDKKIGKSLRDVWDIIAGPVVEQLTPVLSQGARIWWCPTSTVCFLPLHAAGPWKRGVRNLPDLFVSSYTPTLTTLAKAHARRKADRMPPTENTPRFLAIGVPNATEMDELKSVPEELASIREAVPWVDMLLDETATHEAAIRNLHNHPWIHLSCHGKQNAAAPFNSCFHLHDRPLTLYDIIQARLADPEFAFLSACHSATGDRQTPDETLHLAAGLQFAGFRSVVGTLWAMVDDDGPDMARIFYRQLFRESGTRADCRDTAKALHMATQALRRRVSKDRWVNFIHIGV